LAIQVLSKVEPFILKKIAGWWTGLQGIAFCAEVIFHGLRATIDLPFVE
jgi:hypothetical protein